MSFITNDQIQSALVSYLKSVSSITSSLTAGATEIREDQWQGEVFTYPNIRIRMIDNIPTGDHVGCPQNFNVSFMAFTEEASSKSAEVIAGIIGSALHGKSFSQSGLHISLIVTNLIPAVRQDRTTWRSECLMKGMMSGTYV